MALSCVYRLGQRFGIGYVIDVLRGSENEKILSRGHDRLSTYGIGAELSRDHWQSLIRQLIHRGYLVQDIARFSALSSRPRRGRCCAATRRWSGQAADARADQEAAKATERAGRAAELAGLRSTRRSSTRCAGSANSWPTSSACRPTWSSATRRWRRWRRAGRAPTRRLLEVNGVGQRQARALRRRVPRRGRRAGLGGRRRAPSCDGPRRRR